MKQKYLFLLMMSLVISSFINGQILSFKDDIESHGDFQQNNLVGWTSLDVDGLNTAGPFQGFPGKGGPLGFFVYNPSKTDPVNNLEGYEPKSGEKYFASISSYDGPSNDWLISTELSVPAGGIFSFYAKSVADFAGADKFKVAYSTTGKSPSDFISLNNSGTNTSLNWARFQFSIPAGAKYLAINCVSEAFMMLVDDIEFVPTVANLAPNTITNFSEETQTQNGFQAKFTWTNPAIDKAGNALSTMTGVKVYRGTHPMNLVEIANLPSVAGQIMTYTDTIPGEGSYNHRFVPYNASGNGIPYNTPLRFFGFETIPGAPANIIFSQNQSLQTVISWDPVNYGANGGVLQDPVVGYKITRTLGSSTETLAEVNANTTYTETSIPSFNLYTYTITAITSPTYPGIPAVVSDYSGMNANQVSVTSGTIPSDQPFELNRGSILSQSIYTPSEIGASGLITSLSYFGNLENTSTARYKIYMSVTNRNTFGTTLNNAAWEYFGNQKLLFDGDIEFIAGRNATTILLDQPFYYDATTNKNVIITIIKPLTNNTPSVNPSEFSNTSVEGLRTYFSVGYSVDLSVITSQPAAWTLEDVTTIPSIVVGKSTNFGSVSGKVTLLSNGSEMNGVTVKITPKNSNSYQTETVLTNATGGYNIPALIPGDYVATFSKNTFNTVEINFSVAPNQQLILNAVLDNSLPVIISGKVLDSNGIGLQGINLNLDGFSEFTTVSDATGNFTLEAFAGKQYELVASHPLFISKKIVLTSLENDYTIDPISLDLALNKPGNVTAVKNNNIAEVAWNVPVGQYNEKMLGWGSFITAGDSWGNGGDAFTAGVRFEISDLQTKLTAGASLTHVKVYFANNAKAVIKIYEGPNAEKLVHSQPVSIESEDWYVIELTKSLPVDFTKELWIAVEFPGGQYGAYPIGLDDGPNAPGKKGSMKYEDGSWVGLSLTNKNWNIYGIANNTVEANPTGYKVYRSPASENNWTALTTSTITALNFSDSTLNDSAPDIYKYGVEAVYGANLVSEKGISNNIDHNMFFDLNVAINPDFGSAEGAYLSVWNDENFEEAFVPASGAVTLNQLMHGIYHLRVELDNYEIVELSDIIVGEGSSINVPLNLLKVQPSNLAALVEGNSAQLDWTLNDTFTDKIEKYADFQRQNIGNYIMKDVDGLDTYIYNNFSWPNAGNPMAFMVFNPHATTPPVDMPSFSGRRFLTAFAGPDGANNDWLIIPAGSGGFSFNASSLTNTIQERMKVLYSTTGTEISDFTAFGEEIDVPAEWTPYAFEAPEGTQYVAINYVSNDSYILKIDDLVYERKYDHALYYRIYLDGNLIKDNLTEQSFTLENLITQPTHVAEVEAVYSTGASQKSEIIISKLSTVDPKLNEFAVYPNPSSGKFWLKVDEKADVKIFDMNGRILYSGPKEAGTSVMEHHLPTGTYIIQVQTEKGVASKKIIFR